VVALKRKRAPVGPSDSLGSRNAVVALKLTRDNLLVFHAMKAGTPWWH